MQKKVIKKGWIHHLEKILKMIHISQKKYNEGIDYFETKTNEDILNLAQIPY